jgi:class 3 adenylate cyclase/predicted ATPase
MDFYEVLDQIIDLLRSRGRVTYRALKRQFNLDDAFLEDLKEEIIDAQRVAVEEDGKILVWTGVTEGTPVSASQPTQTSEQPITTQDHSTQVEPPPTEPQTPEAERRQLTVMFSDLVDSTKLSGQLDPEEYREVLRAYQSTCSEVIQRFDGYIAQHLGDALLVYFGYPQAHEDEGQRAVRTGLGMLDAMQTLNERLEQEKGMRLSIRIGVHTGLTVISDVGSSQKHEMLALGEAPNVASRVQGMAEPDSIAMSAATYRLVQGYFTVEDLGAHTLKGVAEPMRVYRVVGESGAQSRLEIAATRGLTPLVGREQEVGLLLERWNQVQDGQGQVVLLSGEGGIGKSRLVQVLKEHVADEPHTRWECRSSPYYQNTALYPITDLFQRTLQFQADDTPEQRLEKLEQELSQYRLGVEETVPLFAPLLSLPLPEDRYPPLAWSPQRQRQKTLESIVAILLEQAEYQAVLFILEDLHWTDPSTLEFLDLLIDQVPTAALCAVLTCRPTFQPTWGLRTHLAPLAVNRLNPTQIEMMAERVAGGKTLPAEVRQSIVERTDGVPLFVEEMTKALLESGHLKETNGHYGLTGTLPALAIPATLQDSLMARLDRLVTAKGIAQLCAVLGRTFTYDLLQAVSPVDEDILQRELRQLVEAELLYQRGLPPQATYTFKHALIQDAAYQSLLRSTRQGYHRHIADVLAEQFSETVETQPELLAHHYTEAGMNEQAVDYWHKAGQKAIERSANVEAISHLTRGLELLKTRPETSEHDQDELSLLITLGPALIAMKGYTAAEVEHVYNRAYELCRSVGEEEQHFSVLTGLRRFYQVRGDLITAREIGEQLLTIAKYQQDPTLLLEAYWSLSGPLFHLGEFALLHAYLDQAITIYASQGDSSQTIRHGTIPGIHCLGWLSVTLWMRGYPDQALQRSHQALTFARQQTSPFALDFVLTITALLHHYRREWSLTQEYVESSHALRMVEGTLQTQRSVSFLEGWVLVVQAQSEQGIDLLCRWLNEPVSGLSRPYIFVLLADAYGKLNQIEAGLKALTEGLTLVEKIGKHCYEAELYRLKGELLLQQSADNHTAAETCFQKALSVAHSQQTKSLELRAATSLSRLWQQQGKHQDAYDLLAPVYGWFTEGHDTADLIDAKTLLDELS